MLHAPRTLGGFLSLSVLLGGCAQVQHMTGSENCSDPSMSPSRQMLCNDDKTFNKTVTGDALLGGLAGAVGGAATCAATGKNVLACAAIGGGVGLFAGGVAGYLVAKKEQAGKENVRQIDAVTDDIRQENDSLAQRVSAAKETVAEDEAGLTLLQSQVQAGSISADQKQAKLAESSADSMRLADIIKHHQARLKNFTDAVQQLNQSTPSYRRQIAELQNQIASLDQQKAELDHAISVTG